MGILDTLQDGITGISNKIEGILGDGSSAALGGAVVGSALTGAAIVGVNAVKKSRSKRGGKRIKHTPRGWKQDRSRRSKQKWEVAYRKRKAKKSRSHKRKGVHYTKNGQPYVIMASGKARFIKKRKR